METTNCQRCGAKCAVTPLRESNAKMLKRAKGSGLCVNCAVHDWLRNTYPVNILLAQSGPKALQFEHIRQQFANIMKSQKADAEFGEINWDAIIKNWALPFKNKIKKTAANPVSQEELDREPEERARREAMLKEEFEDPGKKQRAAYEKTG